MQGKPTERLIEERVSERVAQKDVEVLAIRQAHEQRVAELEREIAEQKASFDLRWKADMRAIKRWQEATGETLVWPDHADLCVWLLARLASYEAALREIEAACNVKQWGVQTRELANYLGPIARKALEAK